jgi:hypothetical protein
MNQEKLAVTSCDPTGETRWGRRGLHWPAVFLSALLMLAVAVPTMAVEEDWHGRPMIDQGTPLAVLAGCLVAAAFLAGGVVAGHRRPSAAVRNATAAAGLAVTGLLVGALFRRLWFVHEGVPGAVAWLWCLGVVAGLLLAAAGSLLGRRLAPHSSSVAGSRGS